MRMNWVVTFPLLEQAFKTWRWTEWSHFPGWNRHYLHEDELNDNISLVGTGILYTRMHWMVTFPWLEQAFFTWGWTEYHILLVGTGILYMRMNWLVTFPWLEQAFFTWGWTEWSHFPGWSSYSIHEDELIDHISRVGTGNPCMRKNWMVTFHWLEQAYFTWGWTEWSHFAGWNSILYMRMNWIITFPWLEHLFLNEDMVPVFYSTPEGMWFLLLSLCGLIRGSQLAQK